MINRDIFTTTRNQSNDDRLGAWKDKHVTQYDVTQDGIPTGWRVQYNPKQTPDRSNDWDWFHVDYDGAPDSGDNRCGTADSITGAINQINLINSPPAEQPNGANTLEVIAGAFGFVLWMVVCAAFLGAMAAHFGLW